jgi:sugar phosphate isomerase/epimerase
MEYTSRLLVNWYSRGLKDTDMFQKYKKEMIEERALKSKPFFKKMLESLKILSEYAQKNNIILGVENRFYYQEIPSFDELAIVLDEFKNSNIFYWHDVGHAYILANLGLGTYRRHLERYGQRIGGVHLHDVVGAEDHQAPLKGSVDFKQLVPYLKPDTIKVMEIHPPATEAEIKKAKKYLEELFIDGN